MTPWGRVLVAFAEDLDFIPRTGFQLPRIPIPRDSMPCCVLCGNQTQTCCTDIHASETLKHIKEISLRRKIKKRKETYTWTAHSVI